MGELERQQQIADLVGQLTQDDVDARERGRLLGALTAAVAGGVRAAGGRAAVSGRWLADAISEIAPHLPVRDVETIRRHHAGLQGDALVEDLIRTASRTTAAIGAAGGVLAALQAAAPPSLLLAPVQLTAETLAVVAVELKLVAELHVLHGRAPLAPAPQVATAYLAAWASRRALEPGGTLPGLGAVLGATARQQVRRRVARRLGRNVATLVPFLAGAVAGAELNRRETRSLGDTLHDQLRRR